MSDSDSDDDFFVPVRLQTELNGPITNKEHEEDCEYFRNKLFAALKIPKEYLNKIPSSEEAIRHVQAETKKKFTKR